MPAKNKKRGRGGGRTTTTAAAAASATDGDDDGDDGDDMASLPPGSKKAMFARTRGIDAARAKAVAGATAPAVLPPLFDVDDDDDGDDDDSDLSKLSKKAFNAKIRADDAARANAAAAAVAPVAPTGAAIEPYFVSGAATARATSLPRLPLFVGRKSAAPATVSVPTELVAAAAAGRAEAEKANFSESLMGFDFDLPDDDISFSGGGDMGGVENEAVDEDAGVDGAELPPLLSVFECDHINRKTLNDKDGWECNWCGKFFTPLHATRALKHVLKIKKGGIIACKAIINPRYLARYQALNGYHSDRIESGKQTAHRIDLSVESKQLSAAASLLQKRGHDGGSSISSAAAASALTGAPPSGTKVRGSSVPFVPSRYALFSSGGQQTMKSVNMDIRHSNNARVEMAIADFFHSQNIPDAVVESPEFKRLVRQCRLVDNNFVIPNKKKIGGELLNINFENIKEMNKTNLLKEAAVFGIVLMGDGATIHRMPLLNILAMSGNTPPLTIGILDCTSHMASGGKKDATYVADIFAEKVEEYDPNHQLTDLFYFDGAASVQKAGRVLVATYPRTFCYHGGEHVVALFFTSLSKIKPIRVMYLDIICFIINSHVTYHLPNLLLKRFSFLKLAGCTMSSDRALITVSMLSSWLSRL